MGGVRGVTHYMQRTALQGSPAMLSRSSSNGCPGAPKPEGEVHPFRKRMPSWTIGYTLKTASRTVTLEDIEHFAHFTGDTFYAHMDEEAAKASPIFEGRVAHGYLILSFAAGLFVEPAPGPVLANTGLENLRFQTPLYPGDSMRVELTVKSKSVRDEEKGEVRWAVYIFNQKDEVVATYDLLTMNGFRWDRKTFRQLGTWRYPGEGWGLTQNGRELIMSDGTAELRFLDPETLQERRRVRVTASGQPVAQLNELEFVNGEILANVWLTPRIARIDPATGNVTGWIDLSPLVRQTVAGDTDAVLNGIAYDAERDRLFVTGKNWPRLYEIDLVPAGQTN
jgi:glutamine cyclotransferase